MIIVWFNLSFFHAYYLCGRPKSPRDCRSWPSSWLSSRRRASSAAGRAAGRRSATLKSTCPVGGRAPPPPPPPLAAHPHPGRSSGRSSAAASSAASLGPSSSDGRDEPGDNWAHTKKKRRRIRLTHLSRVCRCFSISFKITLAGDLKQRFRQEISVRNSRLKWLLRTWLGSDVKETLVPGCRSFPVTSLSVSKNSRSPIRQMRFRPSGLRIDQATNG